jgi:Na+-transporting NADH:ubiquinone oxidoreductase subunit NqrA
MASKYESRNYGYVDRLGFNEATVTVETITHRLGTRYNIMATIRGNGSRPILDIDTFNRVDGIWQAEKAIAGRGIEISDDQQVNA